MFAELAELEGTEARTVCMELAPEDVKILRTIPGFEDFDPLKETIELDRPGFGLKDAPAAWSKAFSQFMTEQQNMSTLHADPCFYVVHRKAADSDKKALTCASSSHVDDLNATAKKPRLLDLIEALKTRFGKDLKVQWSSYECCGVRQLRDSETGPATLSQNHYVEQMREINISHIAKAGYAKECDRLHHGLFESLRGGLAWTLLCRSDHNVYIAALQRVTVPTYQDIADANTVLAYLKKHPAGLHFGALPFPIGLTVPGDSAYKRVSTDGGQPDGLAMRGAIFAIVSLSSEATLPGGNWHPLEWWSRKHRHVTRNVWSSELYVLTDTCDYSLLLLGALDETQHGVCSSAQSLIETRVKGFTTPCIASTDSMSVYSAVGYVPAKVSVAAHTLHHVQWIQELIKDNILDALVWCDTRDMISDALTKGSIPREHLRLAFAKGKWQLRVPTVKWQLAQQCKLSHALIRRVRAKTETAAELKGTSK